MHRAAAVELAGQVGIDALAPFVIGQFVERLAHALVVAAGVVDQDVDPAQLLDRRRRHRVDLIGAGHVGLRDQTFAPRGANQRRGLLQLRQRARRRDHVGSRLGEPDRHRPAQSAPGAGDDRDLAVKLEAVQDHASSVTKSALQALSMLVA